MPMTTDFPICIVQPNPSAVSETFLRAHAERLPGAITVIHGFYPTVNGRVSLQTTLMGRALRRVKRRLLSRSAREEATNAYARLFESKKPAVVLAEYGPTGVHLLDACRRLGIPLVVHFHGYDASETKVLEEHVEGYARLFEEAAALVVVSLAMKRQLLTLGAPEWKLHVNPCGVDCEHFSGSAPGTAGPTLLAVGRFVEKKAPHLTIRAFAQARATIADARLRMIGSGPLLDACRTLADELGVGDAVTLLGAQPPEAVRSEMRRARAFVQHSIRAPSGDCEGMPVSVLEAGACGLPIIATRHAGIPEAVIEGETGLLVDEGDVDGMAAAMRRMLEEPDMAAAMGRASREWIASRFRLEDRIARLWEILASSLEADAGKSPRRAPSLAASETAGRP